MNTILFYIASKTKYTTVSNFLALLFFGIVVVIYSYLLNYFEIAITISACYLIKTFVMEKLFYFILGIIFVSFFLESKILKAILWVALIVMGYITLLAALQLLIPLESMKEVIIDYTVINVKVLYKYIIL